MIILKHSIEKKSIAAYFLIFLSVLFFYSTAFASSSNSTTEFPIVDPYKATIFGTPPDLMQTFSEPAETKKCQIEIEDRRIPGIFWYSKEFNYTTAMQKEKAPLLFIIAGTGSEHNSTKMKFLVQLFYAAGFHVVALSSPTHMNFVVSASRYAAPGYVPNDVEDLYRVMKWIKTELEDEYEINGYEITGYSLGAMHSAFIAHLDETRKDFSFKKVLMINPPVNLYNSALRFDSWLTPENLGGKEPRQVIDELIHSFSEMYLNTDVTDFDDNFLYALSNHNNFSKMDLKAVIAASFRLSSANMIFTSDVCINAGYIVPVSKTLSTGDDLLPYTKIAAAITFERYVDEYLLPYQQFITPGITKEELIRRCSLESIEEYLKTSNKIFVLGNLDDVILDKSEVGFLQKTFGSRAVFFAHGGHCGNIMFKPFAAKAQEMLKL
ncbi:alpha/beta hydrolase fold domain-containing protein [Desulfovibrio gilichinskyi]|uniref:Alpha/beta hydrolase fold n=1 Tax=Desulfovibrio gilichinskyi TaxID=1519643 RepID=A0A1X7CWQ1_9BACT|nr:alpha/beta hydrolase fold domain-containing protein [Desulfovibrio gilichinskyi]SMF04445.1 alpha/beta hydrolase fold [Desulfovibrio gilichinskyi]